MAVAIKYMEPRAHTEGVSIVSTHQLITGRFTGERVSLMSVREVAEYLDVSEPLLRRLIKRGLLRVTRCPGVYGCWIEGEDLDAFLTEYGDDLERDRRRRRRRDLCFTKGDARQMRPADRSRHRVGAAPRK